jgi:hypothetical protein
VRECDGPAPSTAHAHMFARGCAHAAKELLQHKLLPAYAAALRSEAGLEAFVQKILSLGYNACVGSRPPPIDAALTRPAACAQHH